MMILDELTLVHYYYPGTDPMGNIMLLPEEEAFRVAAALAEAHPETMSFYRFADFTNYYPRRKQADEAARKQFIALGGKPELEHPYSFVLFGNDYLKEWFGKGGEIRIPLSAIPEDQVSFTYGDSCSSLERRGVLDLTDRKTLLAEIGAYPGTPVDYAEHIRETCGYIEVQVWCPMEERIHMTDHHTLDWYRDHMEEFVSHTGNVDMTPQYRAFMELLPAGSRIMDLGCGAGGASLYFTRAGYSVLAVDGCREFCEYTRQRAGCETRNMFFEELDDEDAFDGIWACASLLHVPKAGLPGILRRIHRALKKDGVFYASFKYGETEREKNGRRFSDFTEDSLRALLDEAGGFRVKTLWVTHDARPERSDERWVNVLCLAEKE